MIAETLEDRIRIQNEYDKLEKCCDLNWMKFNEDACKGQHLERRN